MWTDMRFQKKVTLLYTILGLLTAILFGGIYYKSSVRKNLKDEYLNLQMLAQQYEQQWTQYVKPMESIAGFLLSNQDVLDAIYTLAHTDAQTGNAKLELRRREAKKTLSEVLTTDYIGKTFYRIILFNQRGDVVASKNSGDTLTNVNKDYRGLSWLQEVTNTKGIPIVVGKHMDDWGEKTNPEVFSVVKEIQGRNMGYIEVQRRTADLEDIFQVTNQDIHFMILDGNGELLYSSQSLEKTVFYSDYAKTAAAEIDTVLNGDTNQKEVIALRKSEDGSAAFLVAYSLERIKQKSFYVIPITLILSGSFFLIAFIYIYVAAKHLTKPIRELRELMDNTKFETRNEGQTLSDTNDEIALLNQSYQNAIRRLEKHMENEQRISLLQLQAQFDLLQAQINPHFLYNVLNVISNRGIALEDDEICEICECLANMLRYSTNTKKRYATIAEELEYVEQYFYLMKTRFEYRLEYQIHVHEKILGQLLPKIVLQQLVENSIAHGYENSAKSMKIIVDGSYDADRWIIEILDNGNGFSDEILQNLRVEIRNVRENILDKNESIEMEIGGMGIVNTYARLLFVYRESLDFHMENTDEGAKITISASMNDMAGITAKKESRE